MINFKFFIFALQESAAEAWEASGHQEPGRWLSQTSSWVSLAFLALLIVLLTRCLGRQSRYRAHGVLSEVDLAQLKQEIAAAERRTVGEILPVVVERSDAHPQALWLSGLGFVLLGSALLAPWLPFDQPWLVLLAQLGMGAVGYGLARAIPDFARLFVREARATEMAEEQAFQEFYRHGLQRTEAATGVLLFISLFERRVVVLADEGINAKVARDQWDQTDAAILEHIAKGNLHAGLSAGIQNAAKVLEEHFPWTDGDRNEVPDRIIVRKQ